MNAELDAHTMCNIWQQRCGMEKVWVDEGARLPALFRAQCWLNISEIASHRHESNWWKVLFDENAKQTTPWWGWRLEEMRLLGHCWAGCSLLSQSLRLQNDWLMPPPRYPETLSPHTQMTSRKRDRNLRFTLHFFTCRFTTLVAVRE